MRLIVQALSCNESTKPTKGTVLRLMNKKTAIAWASNSKAYSKIQLKKFGKHSFALIHSEPVFFAIKSHNCTTKTRKQCLKAFQFKARHIDRRYLMRVQGRKKATDVISSGVKLKSNMMGKMFEGIARRLCHECGNQITRPDWKESITTEIYTIQTKSYHLQRHISNTCVCCVRSY